MPDNARVGAAGRITRLAVTVGLLLLFLWMTRAAVSKADVKITAREMEVTPIDEVEPGARVKVHGTITSEEMVVITGDYYRGRYGSYWRGTLRPFNLSDGTGNLSVEVGEARFGEKNYEVSEAPYEDGREQEFWVGDEAWLVGEVRVTGDHKVLVIESISGAADGFPSAGMDQWLALWLSLLPAMMVMFLAHELWSLMRGGAEDEEETAELEWDLDDESDGDDAKEAEAAGNPLLVAAIGAVFIVGTVILLLDSERPSQWLLVSSFFWLIGGVVIGAAIRYRHGPPRKAGAAARGRAVPVVVAPAPTPVASTTTPTASAPTPVRCPHCAASLRISGAQRPVTVNCPRCRNALELR